MLVMGGAEVELGSGSGIRDQGAGVREVVFGLARFARSQGPRVGAEQMVGPKKPKF